MKTSFLPDPKAGVDSSWPLIEIVKQLASATENLLEGYGRDDFLGEHYVDTKNAAEAARAWLVIYDQGASEVGFSVKGMDSSGEVEMRLFINGIAGPCWLSKEMWQAIGESAGWIAEKADEETEHLVSSVDLICPVCDQNEGTHLSWCAAFRSLRERVEKLEHPEPCTTCKGTGRRGRLFPGQSCVDCRGTGKVQL